MSRGHYVHIAFLILNNFLFCLTNRPDCLTVVVPVKLFRPSDVENFNSNVLYAKQTNVNILQKHKMRVVC